MSREKKEIYYNDFTSGLVSKKLYARTDLDIMKKGSPKIQGCIPNMFGNLENFDFYFNKKSSLQLPLDVLNNIKNNKFIFAYRSDLNSLLDTVVESLIYTFDNAGKLYEIDLNAMTFKKYTSIVNGTVGSTYVFANIVKIYCFDYTTDSIIVKDGSKTSYINISQLRVNSNSAYTFTSSFTNFIKFLPALSELKKLNEFRTADGRVANYVSFSYDIRGNTATIVFKDSAMVEIPSSLFRTVELEISFGKFQYLGYGNEWKALKQPLKDTTTVGTDGSINVGSIVLNGINTLFRKIYPANYLSYNSDDVFIYSNRLCIIKDNKLFMSRIGSYDNFSNLENNDVEGIVIDLPFEKYIGKFLFDDLIIFSNRGIFNSLGSITPKNLVMKFISSIVISDTIPPVSIYNGVAFANSIRDEIHNINFNGETNTYSCNKLSSTIDLKNITNLDIINANNTTNESIVVSDDEKTYLFNYNNTEQIKFWTSLEKTNKDFMFSFFDSLGNINYTSINKTNNTIMEKNGIVYTNGNFEFKLFKPDTSRGEFKPNFFNKNNIVTEVEIMYTGNGRICVNNNSQNIETTIVERQIFADTNYSHNFDNETKIASSKVHFQYGDDITFKVYTDEKIYIQAINLVLE